MKNRTILLQLQAFLDLSGAHFSFLFFSFPGSKFTEMQKLTVRPLLCFALSRQLFLLSEKLVSPERYSECNLSRGDLFGTKDL